MMKPMLLKTCQLKMNPFNMCNLSFKYNQTLEIHIENTIMFCTSNIFSTGVHRSIAPNKLVKQITIILLLLSTIHSAILPKGWKAKHDQNPILTDYWQTNNNFHKEWMGSNHIPPTNDYCKEHTGKAAGLPVYQNLVKCGYHPRNFSIEYNTV